MTEPLFQQFVVKSTKLMTLPIVKQKITYIISSVQAHSAITPALPFYISGKPNHSIHPLLFTSNQLTTMSASSQSTISSTSPNHYEACYAKNGVYAYLIQKIKQLDKLTLGGANYQTDFVCRIIDRDNYKYVDATDDVKGL
jgi:hypothetical protein